MSKRSRNALIFFAIFYVGFNVLLVFNQERIIYQPFPQDFSACPGFENARKEIFEGTRMYVEEGEKGIAVLYHGNAGSACDRSFYAQEFRKEGYGLVVPEYAGYSGDPVRPSHERIKKDVRNVVEYLRRYEKSRVVIVGESIGTGAAAYHASISEPDVLVLLSPFSSLADIAWSKFWFHPIALLFLDDAFNNIAALQNYSGSVVIIHGDEDMIIPQRLGQKLFDALNAKKKQFISIKGAGHNDLFAFPETYSALRAALR